MQYWIHTIRMEIINDIHALYTIYINSKDLGFYGHLFGLMDWWNRKSKLWWLQHCIYASIYWYQRNYWRPWDKRSCAVMLRALHLMYWNEQGTSNILSPWDKNTYAIDTKARQRCIWDRCTCSVAIEAVLLEVLRWKSLGYIRTNYFIKYCNILDICKMY
jgi:hypothetical protein